MAGTMAETIQRVFDALGKADPGSAIALVTDDAQGIDEISRRWMRGIGEMTGYIREMLEVATDVHSEIGDVHETEWGDTGVVTFWLEQDYTLEGERSHISAPTTCVLRREQGEWKIALFHSIPLPPGS
jgi:ketosteroid isomerase-like protein